MSLCKDCRKAGIEDTKESPPPFYVHALVVKTRPAPNHKLINELFLRGYKLETCAGCKEFVLVETAESLIKEP